MGYRLSKIYTRTGDEGSTGLGDGTRVSKADLRVDTYGTVDELNCTIGLVIAHLSADDPITMILTKIQHKLFELGAELCIPTHVVLTSNDATELEVCLDELNETLPPLKEFILPGGSVTAANAHLARATCRRAERLFVQLNSDLASSLNPHSLCYLNRLSDLLFVIARTLARRDDGQEVLWRSTDKDK